MITNLFLLLKKAIMYVTGHPQILFALVLLIVIPLLFLYTGQQFLDVGKANQERLQKDRIGLMQDTLVSLLSATNFEVVVTQKELARIAQLNPDIVSYKVTKKEGTDIVVIISSMQDEIGTMEDTMDPYRTASLRIDESIIFEEIQSGSRLWSVYRAVEDANGQVYFLNMQMSLKNIDELFLSREQSAYFSLIFIYCFMIALAYWHVRLTDYRYLYIKTQKANEMKDLFTNMIAHELRAPLTAIKGYASMLDEKVQDAEHKKYAFRIKESSERLIAIVNDLLDVARIQSGKLSVEKSEINISKVVNTVLDELAITASEKEISFSRNGTTEDHMALADAKRLHQALTNLVSNAVKYTEKGVIAISVEDRHAFVEIRVKDTGMGISAEDQKKLFAPFFRVNDRNVNKTTGTGLGMWITKELIELMDAKIGVESIKGVGTHVVITIPKTLHLN